MEAKRRNPYVGPRTFTRDDADLFFGRGREARDLADLVASERLVLFYAQSGAGKSSLINTRLIPRLEEIGFVALPVSRVSGELPEGVAEVNNIFAFNLMLSIVKAEATPNRLANLTLKEFLARLISEDGQTYSFDEHLDVTAPVEGYEAVRHVLIVDQFEEILTTHLNRWPERAAFFRQLEQAMAADPHLWVVLTLREDYLAPLEAYAPLLSTKLQARFYMQRLDRAAALRAIKQPAAEFNRPFGPDVAEALVDNLRQIKLHRLTPAAQDGQDADLAAAYDGRDGASVPGQFVEPVQLQVVCYQLWEKLQDRPGPQITQQDLGQYGDVDAALTEFYEQALRQALGQTRVAEMELRRWFDRQLITEAGTRGTVYRGQDNTAGLPNEIVKVLSDQFLLQTEPRAGGIWVELIHDRFIGPIVKSNRDWFERENKKRQRFRTSIASIIILLLVIAVGYLIWRQAQKPSEEEALRQHAQNLEEVILDSSASPSERLDSLAQLIELPNYQAQARTIFFKDLPFEEKLSFFDLDEIGQDVVASQAKQVRVVYRHVFTEFENNENDTKLLQAMQEAMRKENEDTIRLIEEGDAWLEARASAQSGDWAEAKSAYDEAIHINPENPALYFERAAILKKLGKEHYEDALADLNTGLDLDSQETIKYFERGLLLKSLGRFEEALIDFNRVIDEGIQSANIYYERALTLNELGRFSEALNSFNTALEFDDQDPIIHFERAKTLRELDDLENALAGFSDALKFDPENASIYFERANVFRSLNHIPEALADFERVITLDSSLAEQVGKIINNRVVPF